MKIKSHLILDKRLAKRTPELSAESYLHLIRSARHFVGLFYLRMKTSSVIVALSIFGSICVPAQTAKPTQPPDTSVPVPTAQRVVNRGANHRLSTLENILLPSALLQDIHRRRGLGDSMGNSHLHMTNSQQLKHLICLKQRCRIGKYRLASILARNRIILKNRCLLECGNQWIDRSNSGCKLSGN